MDLNQIVVQTHPSMAAFTFVWAMMAQDALCDEVGGSEYLRVRQEWLNARTPEHIAEFIISRANIGPTG